MSFTPSETVAEPVTVSTNETLQLRLTKALRLELNELSLKAYGKARQWQKMMRKGELRPETSVTASGKTVQVKRLYHFTLASIRDTMEKILADRALAEAKQKLEEVKNADEKQPE